MEGLEHGATDSGPRPLADFSTCAHPLGPCPPVLAAVAAADRTIYPDPAYAALRATLGGFHGTEPERIAVGAGAAELIQRCVRSRSGDVLAWSPSFVEYRRAALQEGRRFRSADSESGWLDLVPPRGTAFLCEPNNPDGRSHDPRFLERAAERCAELGCALVVDLAYAEFLPELPRLPESVDLLLAPNKVAGLVGVRAGYLVASDAARASRLRGLEASWILAAEGVAFLEACRQAPTRDWIRDRSSDLADLHSRMCRILSDSGWRKADGESHFGAFLPPGPPPGRGEWCSFLRTRGIRARDLRNVGMPGWLRFSARPTGELDLLEAVLGS